MTVVAPCPACTSEVDVLPAFDAGECPACSTPRRVFEALADGLVTHDDLEGDDTLGYLIKPEVRRQMEERFDELDDPAEESQYLKEMGVSA